MAKRRANGEGNLRKRKDGRWEGRYTAGRDPETGKAIYKNVLGKTQAEVKAKLKQAIEEAKGLDAAKVGRYTVGQWMEVWFEHYAKVKVVCQFLEFAAGVTNRKRLCHHFPKGTENRYYTLAFGNIDPCHIVHANRSSLLIVDLSLATSLFHHCRYNLFDDTGAPMRRLNLHKSNAANERLADRLSYGRNGPWRCTSGQDSLILTALATMRKKTRLAAVP